MFAFTGAEHEILDGFAWVFAFVEDQLHLLGDGHLDLVPAGKAQRGAGGANTFCHFAAEAVEDFWQLAALTECLSNRAVAGQGARTGDGRARGDRFARPLARGVA